MLALGQAANNYRTIQVKFTRMVYDKENDLVLVNLLEYCRCGPMTQGVSAGRKNHARGADLIVWCEVSRSLRRVC